MRSTRAYVQTQGTRLTIAMEHAAGTADMYPASEIDLTTGDAVVKSEMTFELPTLLVTKLMVKHMTTVLRDAQVANLCVSQVFVNGVQLKVTDYTLVLDHVSLENPEDSMQVFRTWTAGPENRFVVLNRTGIPATSFKMATIGTPARYIIVPTNRVKPVLVMSDQGLADDEFNRLVMGVCTMAKFMDLGAASVPNTYVSCLVPGVIDSRNAQQMTRDIWEAACGGNVSDRLQAALQAPVSTGAMRCILAGPLTDQDNACVADPNRNRHARTIALQFAACVRLIQCHLREPRFCFPGYNDCAFEQLGQGLFDIGVLPADERRSTARYLEKNMVDGKWMGFLVNVRMFATTDLAANMEMMLTIAAHEVTHSVPGAFTHNEYFANMLTCVAASLARALSTDSDVLARYIHMFVEVARRPTRHVVDLSSKAFPLAKTHWTFRYLAEAARDQGRVAYVAKLAQMATMVHKRAGPDQDGTVPDQDGAVPDDYDGAGLDHDGAGLDHDGAGLDHDGANSAMLHQLASGMLAGTRRSHVRKSTSVQFTVPRATHVPLAKKLATKG